MPLHTRYEDIKVWCRAILRDQIAVDPDDAAAVLDLAAIGITNGTWRNSPLEEWHCEGRIDDGGMLRTNVATTKLVRQVINGHLCRALGDAVVKTRDFGEVDLGFSGNLFFAIYESLADPSRTLPDGRTLHELAGESLRELVDHMDTELDAVAASAEQGGLEFALLRAAAHGGVACSHWWGTPWWPDIVNEFIARLDDPHHRHWGRARDRYTRLPPPPPEVADRGRLRDLLVHRPEALSNGASFCVIAGIRFVHEPIQAWRAARRARGSVSEFS